jgi:ribosomal-protein-alanine N-acetyltransferase
MITDLVPIKTKRLVIEQLHADFNVENYLNWLKDSSNKFIISVNPHYEKKDIQKYIGQKNSSPDALLLGIFDKTTGKHIGNGKFEPINFTQKYAVVGVLIGEKEFRGKEIAGEFILACFQYVMVPMGIERLILGVHKSNLEAIKAYSKIGFVLSKNPVLDLDSTSLELEFKQSNPHPNTQKPELTL